MKRVTNVSIGKINFTIEDDAYFRLKEYLKNFEETIEDKREAKEVMEDVEARVAEIFQKEMKYPNQVVNISLVQIVINHLGEIESKPEYEEDNSQNNNQNYMEGEKKFYRDMDGKMLAGVCNGIATYTKIDVTIIRILFVVLAFAYGITIISYLVIWIVAPKATSIAQKLQLRGYATTAENIRKFTSQHK
ncbi:PspC domain-containing protein [Dysgonomonas sp. BGC7]|uniref:PspC domain-containing protein n=1 Tax=Dysgonomonas sp. BGC7 TaxID=1658008 RepID=UPI0006823880|nr:PspC domain-containing protein [Dysgonomonas sp. BGC7]MBD8389995.1 PspC domain-containing protein [Dysgonomonas sp. BGC7]